MSYFPMIEIFLPTVHSTVFFTKTCDILLHYIMQARDFNRAMTAFRTVRFWKILPRASRAAWLLKVLSRASAAYGVDVHLMMNLCKTKRFFGSYCL